jgi:ribonuclease HI
MARVKIVCDASFNERLRLTGYGGVINITDKQHHNQSYMYQGVAGEQIDIQESELTAILCGLRELSRRERLGQVTVDSVQVFTDSKSAVEGLKDSRSLTSSNAEHYRPLFNKIREIISQHGWSTTVDHVHAHIPLGKASGLERLNHIADERAAQMRKAALSSMINPDLSDSRAVSVIIPNRPKDAAESEAWQMIAKEMVLQERRIRLHVPGATKRIAQHPFIQAVALAAEGEGKSLSSYVSYSTETPKFAYQGLDYTMLRYHAHKQGQDTRFSITGTVAERRAALASRLLFGETYPEATNMAHPSGRTKPASYQLYSLLSPLPPNSPRPQTVQGYLDTFLDYVKIPKTEGIQAIMDDLGMTFDKKVKNREIRRSDSRLGSTDRIPDDPLKADLKAVYEHYKEQLNPEQMASAFIDVVVSHGNMDNELFRNSMNRFIRISYNNDPETLINRVVSHARRLDPSLHQTPTPKREADVSDDLSPKETPSPPEDDDAPSTRRRR